MKINHQMMHRDIVRRLNSINKPQSHLAKRLEIGRRNNDQNTYDRASDDILS